MQPQLTFLTGCLLGLISAVLAGENSTDCASQVKACADDRNYKIALAMKDQDFQESCRIFKEIRDCLDNLTQNDENCTPFTHPSEFKIATEKSYTFTLGLCGLDGSLSGCASDYTKCIAKHNQALQSYGANDVNGACSPFIAFQKCSDAIVQSMTCTVEMEQLLAAAKKNITDKLEVDCFPTCERSLSICQADIPEDLAQLTETGYTDTKQETLCADLNAAQNCLNETQVQDLCTKDGKSELWLQTVEKQKNASEEYCSVRAETCTAQINSCGGVAEEGVTWGTFSSIPEVKAFCSKLESTLDCIEETSKKEFCQASFIVDTLVSTVDEQRQMLEKYCGNGKCRLAFPSCFKLMTDMKDMIINQNVVPSCAEFKIALECGADMSEFEPCHAMEFGNVTFDNLEEKLKKYKPAECDVGDQPTAENVCSRVLPDCYADVVGSKQSTTCSEATRKRSCAQKLLTSRVCRESDQAQLFGNAFERESIYASRFCSGVMSQASLILLVIALLVSSRFQRYSA